ncbi:MAG: UvrD-helicase domain-containing protein [Anaerolineae bacterium]|nr:UvrD-helicase domain-containing protein [Anaerolineae bacterium]MDW8172217.1 UvrD-helicase domain-containing protein [Anaerolineae bacterium]
MSHSSITTLNAHQRPAVEIADVNLLLDAGAGAGKTHVLVERFLHLLATRGLREGWRLNNVVAITFTRLAAQEMRTRLRYKLSQRSDLAHYLADMDSARVDTIHGLCTDLLRQNAALLGLDPAFEVQEEAQAALLRQEVYQAVLRQTKDADDPDSRAVMTLFRHYRAKAIQDAACAAEWMALDWQAVALAAADDPHEAALLRSWQALLRRLSAAYRERKRALNILDFDDLESLAVDLLSRVDVRARYQGAEIKHLMVDEFQDTNARQWAIVQGLANLSQGGTLFVVGDAKQSIYGFRGADVRIFDQVRRAIEDAAGRCLPLQISFRAHPDLLTILNATFARVFAPGHDAAQDYAITYDEQARLLPNRSPSPRGRAAYQPLELILIDKGQHADDADDEEQLGRRREALAIAQRLQALYADGALVYDKTLPDDPYRPFDYGDAALLLRSLSQVRLYEDAFKALGIPFITIAGRGFYERQEIWDVLNLLRALYQPQNDLALASALRSPLFAFSDDLLLALRWRDNLRQEPSLALRESLRQAAQGTNPWLSAEQAAQCAQAEAILARLGRSAGRLTVAELLRQVYDETHYLAMLSGLANGPRLRSNALQLITIAQTSQTVSLGTFLRYVDELRVLEVRQGEAAQDVRGAVRLMSIHASKGLEFPVVVLADASYNRTSGESELLLYDERYGLACKLPDRKSEDQPETYQAIRAFNKARQEHEDKRLLYVAMTRAADCLILSGQISFKTDGKLKKQGWLSELLCSWLGLPDDALRSEDVVRDWQLEPNGIEGVRVRIHRPAYERQALRRPRRPQAEAWETVKPDPAAPAPPLLAATPRALSAQLGHLSATQLGQLGCYASARQQAQHDLAREHRQRFLRQVLDAAPSYLEAVRPPQTGVSRRQVGQIVHEALRHWQFPHNTDGLDEVLRGYAWDFGVSRPQDVDEAVREARRLLERFTHSTIYGRLTRARRVYRELPFIYRTERRLLHGVMDVLYQDAEGLWHVLDYKTNAVPHPTNPDAFALHAAQFHLQIGAYCAGVGQHWQAQGLSDGYPGASIHYIRYNATVTVQPHEWQAALADLEALIGQVVSETP